MKSNALKHRILSVMMSGMIMVAMMAVQAPVYAAEIELPINEAENETESIWEKVAESESDTPEVALRAKETLFEKSINERIVNILPEEEEETEEAVNYIPRLEAPERSNPYFHELNLYYRFGLGMPNCTAYAYGRAYEILGRDPELSIPLALAAMSRSLMLLMQTVMFSLCTSLQLSRLPLSKEFWQMVLVSICSVWTLWQHPMMMQLLLVKI